jgi:molecular chaperone HscB
MNLQENHFSLFGLPERFAIDAAALDRAYREVQTQVHPDRFARGSAAEQRVAMQWATRANEAYRVLRDPLQRAIYLCVLRGQDPADEANTRMPQAFLMQQLEWREALDEAKSGNDADAIDRLRGELDAACAALVADVEGALDRDGDPATAAERVRQWMFVERVADDVPDARRRGGIAVS